MLISSKETRTITKTIEKLNIFKERLAVKKTCIMYALVGFIYTMLDELFPLWTVLAQNQGGLDFGTDQIGITNSVGGVAIVIIQLFVYKPFAKKLGLIRAFRFGLYTLIPIAIILPAVNLVTPDVSGLPSYVFWILLLPLWVTRQLSGTLSFTTVHNLITNSVYYFNMGAANGLGQSLVALLRGIAPLTTGFLFSWSTTNGLSFPLNIYFMFFVQALCAGAILLYTIGLPLSLNKPKAEIESETLINSVK